MAGTPNIFPLLLFTLWIHIIRACKEKCRKGSHPSIGTGSTQEYTQAYDFKSSLAASPVEPAYGRGRGAERHLVCLVIHFGHKSRENKTVSDNLLPLCFSATPRSAQHLLSQPFPASFSRVQSKNSPGLYRALVTEHPECKTCLELFHYYVQVVEGLEPSNWGWLSHPKGKKESGAFPF